jgi:signal transduction histidine kinase
VAQSKQDSSSGSRILYCAILIAALYVGLRLSKTGLALQVDDNFYDFCFRHYDPPKWKLSSIILAIDEKTLRDFNGIRGDRRALAAGLEAIKDAHPRAVAVDVILSDPSPAGSDDDAILATAFSHTRNLVLSCDFTGRWEYPIPAFRQYAAAIGEVHTVPNDDAVSRELQLIKRSLPDDDERRALALEAYRVSRNASILSSTEDVQVGDVIIPAPYAFFYKMRIRYVPPSMGGIPRVSIADLVANPSLASQFTGKVVFAGMAAQTAGRDRWMTPYSDSMPMPGVEMHANIYETIANRLFLVDAPLTEIAFMVLLVVAAGLIWRYTSGLTATLLSSGVVILAHLFPYALFTHRLIVPYMAAIVPTWLAIIGGASWQYLYVRRRLFRSEAERGRYQQAMHFVTHEMRTPLTAIQGSSELITRYPAMPDVKRKQINELIVSESKRLGRMIEVFLNVERLSAGQMELKNDVIPLSELVESCQSRARPLAERKQIALEIEPLPDENIRGDRELMEYAFYNLLTNAIKYSPAETRVRVFGTRENGRLRLSVEDQGIGMDQKEVRRIFEKFYRTRRAEQSGEVGTGIGLSIVEQIVSQHGGSIDVVSAPGKGSCFTLVLPAFVPTEKSSGKSPV